jgi:hypothetical protein
MGRFFTINGKRYTAKPFDFNTVCDLEDNGVSLQEMSKKPMSMARAYFALCFNGDKERAGNEIQEHVKAGGNFNELYTVMGEEMNDSDFFQALNKGTGEETQTLENEKAPKSK